MNESDIQKLVDNGESTKVQFKERITDKYDIGCELVAFSNSHGGLLLIGVNDKTGNVNPLSYQEVQEATNLIGNMASENVIPSILLNIENIAVNGGSIVAVTVKEGLNKPYHDNKGIIWVKNGADKRKVFDNAELSEMMSSCGTFAPDEAAVNDITINDLDESVLKKYLFNRFAVVMNNKGINELTLRDYSLEHVAQLIIGGISVDGLLRNLRFVRNDGKLTVAAVLLFAKHPQRWLPACTAKCICYVGNSVGGTEFRDKVRDEDMEGCLLHQFDTIMAFFKRNLQNVQTESEFNSLGRLEIPQTSLVEFVVNALVHRSLNIKAPVRIFIFDNRVEIHSPGTLPNGLSVDDIVKGTSMPRNLFLFNNANFLLPYTGVGSGIVRALEDRADVSFENNDSSYEFVIVISRNNKSQHQDEHQDEHQVTVQHQDEHQDEHQVAPTSKVSKDSLTVIQRDIVNYCSIPRTAQEIFDRIGVYNQSRSRKKYIQPLIELGFLEMTLPNVPNSKLQKYRKTKR